MLFQIKAYLQFLWKSKNEHAVHSPFVFSLLTKCFYDTKSKPEYSILENNKRGVSKTVGISPKRAKLLFRISNYFQPDPSVSEQAKQSILEIGPSSGLVTSALSLGNPKAKITTLENHQQTATITKSQIFDLIFFNGKQQNEATLDYFEILLPTINNETVWIFDAIHGSTKMEETWKSIKNHPKVTVTIDTFQWGLVFFRREQEKEHFVIRT